MPSTQFVPSSPHPYHHLYSDVVPRGLPVPAGERTWCREGYQCRPVSGYCDLKNDCTDGSDEEFEQCYPYYKDLRKDLCKPQDPRAYLPLRPLLLPPPITRHSPVCPLLLPFLITLPSPLCALLLPPLINLPFPLRPLLLPPLSAPTSPLRPLLLPPLFTLPPPLCPLLLPPLINLPSPLRPLLCPPLSAPSSPSILSSVPLLARLLPPSVLSSVPLLARLLPPSVLFTSPFTSPFLPPSALSSFPLLSPFLPPTVLSSSPLSSTFLPPSALSSFPLSSPFLPPSVLSSSPLSSTFLPPNVLSSVHLSARLLPPSVLFSSPLSSPFLPLSALSSSPLSSAFLPLSALSSFPYSAEMARGQQEVPFFVLEEEILNDPVHFIHADDNLYCRSVPHGEITQYCSVDGALIIEFIRYDHTYKFSFHTEEGENICSAIHIHSLQQLKEVQEELKAVGRRAEEQARNAALDKEALEQRSSAEQAELVARLAAAEQRLEESRAADGRLREEVREKEAQVQALSRDLEERRAADGRLRDEAKELEQRLTAERDRLADSLAGAMQQLEDSRVANAQAEEQARNAALDKEALEQRSSAEQAELVARLAAAEQRSSAEQAELVARLAAAEQRSSAEQAELVARLAAAEQRSSAEQAKLVAWLAAAEQRLEESRAADGRLREEVREKEAQVQALSRDLEERRAADGRLRDEAKELEQRLTAERDRLADSLAGAMQQLEDSRVANAQAEEQVQAAVRERQALEQRLEDLELSTANKVAVKKEMDAWLRSEVEDLEERVAAYHQQALCLTAERDGLAASLESAEQRLVERQAEEAKLREEVKEKAARELQALSKDLEELRGMKAEMERNLAEHEKLKEAYKEESKKRKKFYNLLEELKGKVRVNARLRPLSKREEQEGHYSVLERLDEYTLRHPDTKGGEPKLYEFNQVFDHNATQQAVFKDTQYLIQSVFDGFNVCILAYGQTGSGKTFTIHGTDKDLGLMPRAMQELFNVMKKEEGSKTYKLQVRMLELYQDTLKDLLLPENTRDKPKLKIRESAKGVFYVENETLLAVKDLQHLQTVVREGMERRIVASTHMNAESSRSHLVISIIVETTDLLTKSVCCGKLSFVDLAGSENLDKSGSVGEQQKEARAINTSLSALVGVFTALAQGKGQGFTYRGKKLTELLSDSLGGNAKTLMFVNVSPANGNLGETARSLAYAKLVRAIKNNALQNKEDMTQQEGKKAEALQEEGETRTPLRSTLNGAERSAHKGVQMSAHKGAQMSAHKGAQMSAHKGAQMSALKGVKRSAPTGAERSGVKKVRPDGK
ncbi:unnamed protein product [Closterium sp. Naga37s-1]|nr:unnamed protein product [Closterium sp. Naga37s-1]